MTGNRTGAALLEVMVALAILLASGAAATGAVGAALGAERRAARAEDELLDADRLLTALSLLTRDDLDLRLGVRVIGSWKVEILRPESAIYRIALARADAPERLVLLTLVHRPPQVAP